jgi:hypothetical protein
MRNCSRVMMRYLSRLRRSDNPIGCAELRFLATSCSFPGRSPERDSAVSVERRSLPRASNLAERSFKTRDAIGPTERRQLT